MGSTWRCSHLLLFIAHVEEDEACMHARARREARAATHSHTHYSGSPAPSQQHGGGSTLAPWASSSFGLAEAPVASVAASSAAASCSIGGVAARTGDVTAVFAIPTIVFAQISRFSTVSDVNGPFLPFSDV